MHLIQKDPRLYLRLSNWISYILGLILSFVRCLLILKGIFYCVVSQEKLKQFNFEAVQ